MIKNGLKERRFEMNGKSKLNSVKTLGTATDGNGSERYQMIKKMVISGVLSGTAESIKNSGLMIGSGTAKKYNAALIRDGVIPPNNPPKKQIHEEEIRETQKFDDFVSFVNGIMDRKEVALDVVLAGAASILIDKFEDRVEKIECSLIENGGSRVVFYRTGVIKKES